MSPAALHEYVYTRFCEVFGNPHHTLAKAAQWSLNSSPTSPPVNILLNWSGDQTSLWVFDPHPPNGDEPVIAITSEDQVDGLIAQIQERVRRAGESFAGATLKVPARIDGFVRGISGWSGRIASGAADAAKVETEKVRIFGRFLAEHDDFADAFRRNRSLEHHNLDRWLALDGLCTYLNAVADLSRPDPTRSVAGATG